MTDKRETRKFIFQGIVFPLAALIAVTVIVLCVYNTRLVATAEERVYRLLADSAATRKVSMEERVEASLQQLDIISAGIDWSRDIYTDEKILRELKTFAGQSQFVNVAIGTTDGRLLYQNGEIAYCADRPYYRSAMNGETSAQFLAKGRMSGESVFVFAVPAYDNGSLVGMVVATRTISDISRELVGVTGENQDNFLCDKHGNIVAVPAGKKFKINPGGNIRLYFRSVDSSTEIRENDVSEYTYNGKKYFGVYIQSGLKDIYIFSVTTASYASNIVGLYSRLGNYVTAVIFAIAVLASAIVIIRLIRRINIVNALELERRKKLEEYHSFLNKRSLEYADAIGSFYLNLTRNECDCGKLLPKTMKENSKWSNIKTVDDLCSAVEENIYPADFERYMASLSRDRLIAAFENGTTTLRDEFLFYDYRRRYVWIRIITDLVRDPMTDDLEALTYALNINREKRFEQIGQKLINDSLVAMGLIDLKSGLVFGIKTIGSKVLENYDPESGLDFDSVALRTLETVLSKQDFEYIKSSVCMKNIVAALENSEEYSLTTHLNNGNKESDGYYRISFSYLDERRESIVVSCENITDILASKMDIETGLYNITGFHERVSEWINANPGKRYRVYRYKIDGFNNINAVYGYDEGNRLLREIGNKMRSYNTEDSFAARISDDHFARFCSDGYKTAEECYERLANDFADYPLDYPISFHSGVYDLCEENCDPPMMLYKAYLALQSVEGDFANHVAHYRAGLMQATEKQQQLLSEVKNATDSGQFEVWFQPQFNYVTGKLVGAEALVRWRHPERGLIPPSEFVPLLERSKQITMVDSYVWKNVCRYIRKWKDKGVEVPVSVNVSRVDIRDTRTCETLAEYVEEYGISPAVLRLEITESAYMNETEDLRMAVNAFEKAGFIVEMDDFGAGYSSLNILKELDIDILKLDMKLVSEIGGSNAKNDVIIRTVVEMARSLNIEVIAEGVETKAQAEFLKALGCVNMQGYYFGKPMCVKDFEKTVGGL